MTRPTTRISRRQLLQGAAVAGAGAASLGLSGTSYSATTPNGLAPSGAKGLGPGGALLKPDSLPYPHLAPGTDTVPEIEHIVVLMMENHSFDDHFGTLGRGDGLTLGPHGKPVNYNPSPNGGYIVSFPMPNTWIPSNSQIGQNWDTSHLCWNHGKNNGFAENCGPASMGYYTRKELPYYHSLASHFPIGDRYFCSVLGQTYPNRRYLIAATSLGNVATNATGISSSNPPNGTIFDRLDAQNITWRDYYPEVPTAALYLPNYLNNQTNGRMAHINQFLSDAAAGQLPSFSLLDPYTIYSEENSDISIGEAYAARLINAVLESPTWSKTMMFLVYDEHGGWFDHVPPQPAVRPDDVPPEIVSPPDQPGTFDYTGFRVPCVVISPYAKKNFVSHTFYDHTSILKTIETKWNLPAMTYRDANAHHMFDFLDLKASSPAFAQPPKLASPLNPFIGPLPASSDSPGFHPIGTAPNAADLPPAAYQVAVPPKHADKLIAANTKRTGAAP